VALGTFIAGAYSATYNAVAIGITEQGIRLQFETKAEEIGESDAYGEMLIDFIFRGSRLSLVWEGLEYKAGSVLPFWPWGGLGTPGVIGRLASNVAMALVMTSTTGTPAVATPATQTFSKAILSPNNNLELLYNSKLRKVPVKLTCLPYDSGGGTIVHGSST